LSTKVQFKIGLLIEIDHVIVYTDFW